MHECINWTIVMNHPDAPWDWCGLSRNPNLTFSIIKEHIDYILGIGII